MKNISETIQRLSNLNNNRHFSGWAPRDILQTLHKEIMKVSTPIVSQGLWLKWNIQIKINDITSIYQIF